MSVDRFVTERGLEVPAITTGQMREVDRVAVQEVGPNLFQMMENAGRNLALAVRDYVTEQAVEGPVLVLAGTGGNGGGGICAARHLANHGVDVAVAVTSVERLTSVPAAQLQVYRGTDGRIVAADRLEAVGAGIVVDALIGYSLAGPPRGMVHDLISWAGGLQAPVVSLDVPSGIDASTGEAPGVHVRATATLTLALPKRGLDAPAVGELWLADIGIPMEVYRRVGIDVPAGLFATGYRLRLSSH